MYRGIFSTPGFPYNGIPSMYDDIPRCTEHPLTVFISPSVRMMSPSVLTQCTSQKLSRVIRLSGSPTAKLPEVRRAVHTRFFNGIFIFRLAERDQQPTQCISSNLGPQFPGGTLCFLPISFLMSK